MAKPRKTPKKTTRKATRRFTAAEVQSIRDLAEQLGKLISLSGYRSSFSLETIAKEFRLQKYLGSKKGANKKEVFADFIKKVHGSHPRTLKKIVRHILPIAIEKRHLKGDPVLKAEADALSETLMKIGVDLKKEIDELDLPTERPKVVPPPIAVQKVLETMPLHPQLLPDCKDMFVNGHVNESVRKALEKFEKTVQDLTNMHDKMGSDLMAQAFGDTNPKIKFSKLETLQEKNEQKGIRFYTMGMMQWWRNNLSHGDEEQLDHHDAVGRLISISNLFHKLDSRLT